MSNVRYTIEQQKIIDIDDKNILVSAAAGSGKTTVLARRILRLIAEKKADITEMLIVTFTDAAAGEMRARIQKLIKQEIDDGNDTEFFSSQLEKMPISDISTLHSFCMDILRKNFNQAEISPAFKIARSSVISIFKNESAEEVLEKYFENGDKNFLKLADNLNDGKNDKNIIKLIIETYNFIMSHPDPWKWLKKSIETYNFSENEFLNSDVMKYHKKQLLYLINRTAADLKNAYQICISNGMPAFETIEDDISIIETLKYKLKNDKIDEFYKDLKNINFSRLKTLPKKMKESCSDAYEQVKKIRNDAKKEIKAQYIDYSQAVNRQREMYPTLVKFFELIKDFNDIYSAKKKEKELLDFSDLEHLTLKILQDETVRNSLKSKYKYIFFDEYQDANNVQERIIENISRKDNLFFVGDVKQSIYGFRLANPDLFNARYEKYNDDELSVKIDLSKNFRSSKAIVDFCNDLFSLLMIKERSGIDYSAAGQELVCGRSEIDTENGVEFYLLQTEEESSITVSKTDILIAEKIKSLVGTKIRDKIITYSDIAVLFRSPKGRAEKTAKYLKSQDISCYVDYAVSDFKAPEILNLLDYMRIIDNERNDEPLLAAMMSHFGGFSSDDMVKIRIQNMDCTLYEAVKLYNGEIKYRIDNFFKTIDNYRMKEKLKPLYEFLQELIYDSGYADYQSTFHNGKQRENNLKYFIKLAEDFETDFGGGIFNFLQYIDRLFNDKIDISKTHDVSGTSDAVRIMSIHKSKGLEFPIVILADLEKNFNTQDNKKPVIFDNKLGIGSRYIYEMKNAYCDTFIKSVIKTKKQKDATAEEIRILYVALTRSMDKLILIGSVKDIKTYVSEISKKNPDKIFDSYNRQSYLNIITAALLQDDKSEKLLKFTDEEIYHKNKREFKSNVNIYVDINLNTDVSEEKQIDIPVILDENIRKAIEQRLNYKYPFIEDTLKPWGLSVSKYIAENSDEQNDFYSDFEYEVLEKNDKINAAQIGTITHKILRHLPIREMSDDEIKKEISKMAEDGIITSEQAGQIPSKWIFDFYKSDILKRMTKATEVFREKPFRTIYKDIHITGIIDCYFIENNEIVIVDYKTDRKMEEDKHKLQIELYAEALSKGYNIPVKQGIIYYLRYAEIRTVFGK